MMPAAAPRRVLLIGNSAYQHLPALRTPRANVEALREVLANMQSEPQAAYDLSQTAMIHSVDSFMDTVQPGDFVLIYFSGYGYQDLSSGLNYLLPVDYDGRDRTAINSKALSLRRLEGQLDDRKAGTKMLLLDASRQATGLPLGLAGVTPRMNTVVSFSAAENQVAADPPDGGINSYTAALIDALKTPGSTPANVATRAYAEVKGSSGGKQLPFAMMQAPGEDVIFTPMPAPVSRPSRGAGTAATETGVHPQPPGSNQSKVNPKDGLTYVWIPLGTFLMGCSPGDDECFDNEKPAHQVTFTKGFWIGRTEVTQEAFQKVTGKDPSASKGAKRPVENVTWDEARSYCLAAGMRLPTEAEWEYAARAGSIGSRYDDVNRIAWVAGNSRGGAHDVGGKHANAWGLNDMMGNVSEWVADWFADYQQGSATDPQGPATGQFRVVRGGAWNLGRPAARASGRVGHGPAVRFRNLGMRCAGD
jgi:formylglycine-generating enzyme required for sulfatase activity